MVGIDDTYAPEQSLSREERNPNGRKRKRNLLKSLSGKEVTVVGWGEFERKGVLLYDAREGVYFNELKLPITAVQRVHSDLRVQLYGATQ